MDLGLAAEYDHRIADHRGTSLVVELDYLLGGKFLECHIDHANRTLHDLLPFDDYCLCLLTAQHDLGDLRCVSEMGRRAPSTATPALASLSCSLAKGFGHLIKIAAEGDLACFTFIIGIHTG